MSNPDRIDKCLLMLGEAHGKLDFLCESSADHNKRLKSLETTRTRQYAIFGFLGSAIGWFASIFK